MTHIIDTEERRSFKLYRPIPPEHYVMEGYANNPEEVQLEGHIFSDGTCVIQWMTGNHSTAVWKSFEDFDTIHGHPEYGKEVVWL